MKKILATDKERIEKIIELIPEEAFDYFLNMNLFNARYTDDQLKMMYCYSSFSEQIFSQFRDKELKNIKHKFDISFNTLRNFLACNFFRIHKDSFMLYPDQKNSSEPEHKIFWENKLKELRKLTNEVELNYNNLFLIMKKYMENQNEDNSQNVSFNNSQIHLGQGDNVGNDKNNNIFKAKKWWERSWVQIIFVVGALGSVVGLILFLVL